MSTKRSARRTPSSPNSSQARKRPRTSHKTTPHDKLIPLLEFWLSPTNLSHDRFLTNAMLSNEGWVPVSLFATFHKVSQLDADEEDVLTALRAVRNPPLEFSTNESEGSLVRIAGGLMQLKCLIDGVREDEDERTIYIETLPADVKREQVTKIFKRFGKIAYISVPRFPGGACKGFGFVEYRDVEAAEEALKAVRGKQMSESDFPNLRALPRAEWRRRKEEYKDQRHSVQVANAKAKKRVREDSQEGQAEDRGTTTPANALPVVNPDEDVNGVVEETILPTACAAEEEHSVENQCESTPTPPKSINDPGQASTRDDDTVESRGGNPVDAKSPSPLSYESGLILSIDGLQNAKERMTRHIVSASLEQYGKVAFLDLPVKAPHKCRARFATAEGAQIAEAALAPSGGGTIAGVAVTASVLKDKDESDYWIKIRKRRESKRSRNSNKESEKVARKAVRRVAPRKQPTRTKKGD